VSGGRESCGGHGNGGRECGWAGDADGAQRRGERGPGGTPGVPAALAGFFADHANDVVNAVSLGNQLVDGARQIVGFVESGEDAMVQNVIANGPMFGPFGYEVGMPQGRG